MRTRGNSGGGGGNRYQNNVTLTYGTPTTLTLDFVPKVITVCCSVNTGSYYIAGAFLYDKTNGVNTNMGRLASRPSDTWEDYGTAQIAVSGKQVTLTAPTSFWNGVAYIIATD